MANENIYPPYRPENVLGGRPYKLAPKEILDRFGEYIEWAKEHPITVRSKESNSNARGDTYGKDAEHDIPRLLSIGGFLNFIGASWSWWKMLETGKQAQEFLKVKDFLRAYCEEYQKEMASAGIFNANIISRLLGLTEKTENKNVNADVEFKTFAEWKEYVKSLNE